MSIIKKIQKLAIVTGLSALLAANTGCTVLSTVAGPITGAVDGGRMAYRSLYHGNAPLVVPGAICGAVAGPFVGFVKGLRSDFRVISHGFFIENEGGIFGPQRSEFYQFLFNEMVQPYSYWTDWRHNEVFIEDLLRRKKDSIRWSRFSYERNGEYERW